MDRIRRALVATTALLLTACAGNPLAFAMPRSPHVDVSAVPTALDVDWDFGAPVIPVYIDGHGPWNFVLDSGAGTYVLDQRVADKLKLKLVELSSDGTGVATPDPFGGQVKVRHAALIRELRAGPLVERDTGAAVFDLSSFEQVAGTRIDGLLPAAAFRGVLLTFDADEGAVTVTAGELPPADGENVLTLAPSTLACVALEICGEPRWVVIDTGSNGGLYVPATLCSSTTFSSPPTVAGMHETIAGVTPYRQCRLNGTIAWGRHQITRPVVTVCDGNFGMAGNELLREFRVTFDFEHERVRFERSDDIGPIRSRPVRGVGVGFFSTPDDDDAWTVAYVLDESPAAQAGIRVDDRVETVDGQPVSNLPDGSWKALMNTKDVVHLRIVNSGGSRLVDVPVKTLVE